MRISVRYTDPGGRAWAHMFNRTAVKVFFENVLIPKVITADEERGYILAYVLDGQGRLILNIDKTAPITKELYGRVRIEEPIHQEPAYIDVTCLSDSFQRRVRVN